MDTKSIHFLFGTISLFIGLLFLFYIIFNKKNNWYLISFTTSKFLQAVGVFFYSYRDTINDFLSLNIGSLFLIIGYMIEVFNVVSYDFKFRKSFFILMISPIIPFLLLILTLIYIPNYHLAKIVSFMAFYYFAFGGLRLLVKKEKSKFVMLVAISYLLFSFSWLNQIINSLIEKENYQIMSGDNSYSIILYIFASLNLIIGSVGYLLMIKELDERSIKDKNKRIESDNRILNELNTKKDKFFSIIAHDLKGPIGALIQLGQLLHESHTDLSIDKREKMINTISNSARKTYNLLENLLHWSRSETGRLKVKPIELNLNEIVEGNLELLREVINQKRITTKNEILENSIAFGDYHMINTVIRNIISNAIKYVNENGVIIFSSEIDLPENKIIVDIQDNGVGIEQKVVEKLFDLDNDYTTKGTNNESGTGLGLKLCNEFILKNNGEIKVFSNIGKGSIFRIILPIYNKNSD